MTDWSQEPLAEQLTRVARTVRRRWSGLLQPWELSPHQARALRVVCRQEDSRLADVAEALRIAPRSATEVIDVLESKGFVERAPHPHDRRATTVRPTPKGRELRATIDAAREADAEEFFARLTDRERAMLSAVLRKLLDDA